VGAGAAVGLLGLFLGVALPGLGCGVKAAPQPRDLVVPEAVQDLAVVFEDKGVRIAFTLPDKNLGGTRLERIGGYRILREGPDGKSLREEVQFSVSEQVNMRGKAVVFLDVLPEKPGNYRYCAVPLDPYGSRPRSRLWVGTNWEGAATGRATDDPRPAGPGDQSPQGTAD